MAKAKVDSLKIAYEQGLVDAQNGTLKIEYFTRKILKAEDYARAYALF